MGGNRARERYLYDAPVDGHADEKPAEALLTPGQVAEQLRVCRETVYRLVERGELPAARVGSLVRIAEANLEAYLRTRIRPGL